MYDTELTKEEELLYQNWLKTLPEGFDRTSYDYDLRGYAKENFYIPFNGGHMTDKYKKPNHPTFSNQSIYHGINGNYGGMWSELNGQWTFFPSEQNKQEIISRGYFDPTATIYMK